MVLHQIMDWVRCRAALVRFGAVGVATAAIYVTLAHLLSVQLQSEHQASMISFAVAIVFQFFCQRLFSFRSRNSAGSDVWRFGVTVGIGWIVSVVVLELARTTGLPYIAGLLTVVVITAALNWFSFSRWVFAGRTPRGD